MRSVGGRDTTTPYGQAPNSRTSPGRITLNADSPQRSQPTATHPTPGASRYRPTPTVIRSPRYRDQSLTIEWHLVGNSACTASKRWDDHAWVVLILESCSRCWKKQLRKPARHIRRLIPRTIQRPSNAYVARAAGRRTNPDPSLVLPAMAWARPNSSSARGGCLLPLPLTLYL